jgi:hypothetical protein
LRVERANSSEGEVMRVGLKEEDKTADRRKRNVASEV